MTFVVHSSKVNEVAAVDAELCGELEEVSFALKVEFYEKSSVNARSPKEPKEQLRTVENFESEGGMCETCVSLKKVSIFA